MVEALGVVNVDVRANLDPLERGFDQGRRSSQKFDKDVRGSFNRARDAQGRFVKSSVAGAARVAASNRTVTRSTTLMGRAYKSATSSVKSFFATATAAFGIAAVVGTMASFETSMAQVKAITRATEEEMISLRDIAKELGATTEFSASQAASGLRFLGMAGFTAEQSIAAIPAVLNLATAASMDLGRAADITSNIMTAFGVEAARTADIADVLAATASRTNTNVEQVGEAMKFVGPVASALGISMSEAAAGIGALSDAGLQGTLAGTGLRRILSSLASPTKASADAIKSLGLNVGDLDPKVNSITSIVRKLSEAGLDAATAFEIFGDRGAPAVLALIANESKLQQMTATLQGVSGEALRMATIMRDNLGGDIRNLVSAVESMILALGEAGLTSVLRAAIQAMTSAFRFIASNMDIIVKATTTLAVALGLAFGPVILSSIKAVAVAIGVTMVAAVRTLTAAMLANPLGALAVAIATLLVLAYQFRDELSTVIGVDVPAIFKSAANFIIGAFVAQFYVIRDLWRALPAIIGESALAAAQIVVDAGNRMINSIIVTVNALISAINTAMSALGTSLEIGTLDIRDPVEVPNPFRGAAAQAMQDIGTTISDAMNTEYVTQINEVIEKTGDAATAQEILNDMLRGSASALGSTSEAAEKAAKKYSELVESANQFIEEQLLEQRTIGMSVEAANALRYEQDLLNRAANDNINLTASQRQELSGLAAQMAATEANTTALKEAFEFTKSTTKSFFNDFINGIEKGKSVWESFRDAALNAIDKIIDRLLNNFIDAIFQSNNALSSLGSGAGGGGGFLQSVFGFVGNLFGFRNGAAFSRGNVVPFANGGIFNSPTIFPMANGMGVMGEAGPEAVMPLRRGPGGRLGVDASNAYMARQQVEVLVASNDEKLRVFVRREADGQIEERAPQIVKQAVAHSSANVLPIVNGYQQNVAGGDYRG